ncbi:hypothetical protein EDB19DRAFT_1834035 [Suillus lakei]|nr:hypothetical protein EDB19DRAFT_1834035 [Suillus lakei]
MEGSSNRSGWMLTDYQEMSKVSERTKWVSEPASVSPGHAIKNSQTPYGQAKYWEMSGTPEKANGSAHPASVPSKHVIKSSLTPSMGQTTVIEQQLDAPLHQKSHPITKLILPPEFWTLNLPRDNDQATFQSPTSRSALRMSGYSYLSGLQLTWWNTIILFPDFYLSVKKNLSRCKTSLGGQYGKFHGNSADEKNGYKQSSKNSATGE